MVSRSNPENGDVVVWLRELHAGVAYVMHVVPGADQFAYADREEATARAVAYAKRVGVNAWYADRDGRFELLAALRTESLPGPCEFLRADVN